MSQIEHLSFFNKTLLHSRVPKHVFYKFKINTLRNGDGTINNTRYTCLQEEYFECSQILMDSASWDLFRVHDYSIQNDLKIQRKQSLNVPKLPKDNETIDDSFEPFLDQESTYVTIAVYYNSFSINNGKCHELPSPLICADALKSTGTSQEDTLVLHVEGGIILLRFMTSDTHQFIPYVVESVVVKFDKTELASLTSRIYSSMNGKTLILSVFNGSLFIYDINYSTEGVPRLMHRNNIYHAATTITECMTPIEPLNESALISINNNSENEKFLNCIYDTPLKKIHVKLPNDDVCQCAMIIPLAEVGGVLFLHPDKFVVKSINLIMSWDQGFSHKSKYPNMSSFSPTAYYIPQTKLKTSTSFDDYSDNFYKHDQILIADESNVYILEIYYDKRTEVFTSSFRLLFETDNTFQTFIFEPLENSTFCLIYYNENQYESKKVSITTASNFPVLKTQELLWSEYNYFRGCSPLLVNAFESRNSFESKQELWLTKANSKILTKLTFGPFAEHVDSFPNLYNIHKFHVCEFSSINKNYFWGSGERKSVLYFKKHDDEELNPIVDSIINQEILSAKPLNNEIQLIITENSMYFFNMKTLKHDFKFNLPFQCVMASSIENMCIIQYENNGKHIVMLQINPDNSVSNISVSTMPYHANKISMLKLLTVNGTIHLLVGFLNGHLSIYEKALVDENTNEFNFNLISNEKVPLYSEKIDPMKDMDSISYNFIPHDVCYLHDAMQFVLTSINGEYVITNVDIKRKFRTLFNGYYGVRKLSYAECVFIAFTDNKNTVYLSNKTLWKLNVKKSWFPDQITIHNQQALDAEICTVLITPGKEQVDMITVNNVQLNTWKVNDELEYQPQSFDLGIEYSAVEYYEPFGIFIVLSSPGSGSSFKWSYFNPTTGLVRELEDIFGENEHPLSACAFTKLDSSDDFWYLVVGGQSLKVLKLDYLNDVLTIKIIKSFDEYADDITCIKFDEFRNNLFFSCNDALNSQKYYTEDKKINDPELIYYEREEDGYEYGKITSFIMSPSCRGGYQFWIRYSENILHPVYISKQGGFQHSHNLENIDVLTMNDEKIITFDKYTGVVKLRFEHSSSARADLKYPIKASIIDSYSPWINARVRKSSKTKQFITMSNDGQIEYFDIVLGVFPLYNEITDLQWSDKCIGLLSDHYCMEKSCSLKAKYYRCNQKRTPNADWSNQGEIDYMIGKIKL